MDDQINYGNKAKNLEFVANHTDIEIPYFRELSLEDLGNINEILNDFSEEIMIRSNRTKRVFRGWSTICQDRRHSSCS